MLRRNPTRIEHKIIDIEKEYEVIKKEQEAARNKADIATTSDTPVSGKTRTEIIHERIGYDPKPKAQPSKPPIVY